MEAKEKYKSMATFSHVKWSEGMMGEEIVSTRRLKFGSNNTEFMGNLRGLNKVVSL